MSAGRTNAVTGGGTERVTVTISRSSSGFTMKYYAYFDGEQWQQLTVNLNETQIIKTLKNSVILSETTTIISGQAETMDDLIPDFPGIDTNQFGRKITFVYGDCVID